MKTIRICLCAFVAALICILSSCRCESVGETETPACNESTRSNTEAVPQNDQLNEPRYITYAEAHDKFDPVVAEGEYEYSQAIISATEEIKQRKMPMIRKSVIRSETERKALIPKKSTLTSRMNSD